MAVYPGEINAPFTISDINVTYKKLVTDTETEDPTETTASTGAEIINDGILFTAAVDSLDYAEAGFIFKWGEKEITKSFDTVYSSVENSSYSPSDLGGSYMYGYLITEIADNYGDETIEVTPFTVTLSGETVYKDSSEFTYSALNKG